MKIYNKLPKYNKLKDYVIMKCINRTNETQEIFFSTEYHKIVSKKDYDYLQIAGPLNAYNNPLNTYNFPFRVIPQKLLEILNKYSNLCIENGILPEYTFETYDFYVVYDKTLIEINLNSWFCNINYFKNHLLDSFKKELFEIENIEFISFNLKKY